MTRGGTATVVVEPPPLPLLGGQPGPRNVAIAAVADELERLGVARVTILVAGGLLRRLGPHEIALLVPPEFRRRFRGRVVVHDAEADDLVELGHAGNVPLRVNPALVDTDLVVTVTAAETVLHGGPAALLAATARDSLRAAGALSLLETSASQGWRLALELEQLLGGRVASHRRLAGAEPADGHRALRGLPPRPRGGRAARELAPRGGCSRWGRARCAGGSSTGSHAS